MREMKAFQGTKCARSKFQVNWKLLWKLWEFSESNDITFNDVKASNESIADDWYTLYRNGYTCVQSS